MDAKRLQEFRFNDKNISSEVKKQVFSKQREFAKRVHKNHKQSHVEDLYTVETFSEAYDSSAEALQIMLAGLYLQSSKRFDKQNMHLKLNVSVNKVNEGYLVQVHYR